MVRAILTNPDDRKMFRLNQLSWVCWDLLGKSSQIIPSVTRRAKAKGCKLPTPCGCAIAPAMKGNLTKRKKEISVFANRCIRGVLHSGATAPESRDETNAGGV